MWTFQKSKVPSVLIFLLGFSFGLKNHNRCAPIFWGVFDMLLPESQPSVKALLVAIELVCKILLLL